MNSNFDAEIYPLQEETYTIIGIAMEVHRTLGKGFSEIVYKDALEYEFGLRDVLYRREQQFYVRYKEIILPHHFFADFVIEDKIILEVKCKSKVIEEHYAQVMNYLAIAKMKVGLIINFSNDSLEFRRVIR